MVYYGTISKKATLNNETGDLEHALRSPSAVSVSGKVMQTRLYRGGTSVAVKRLADTSQAHMSMSQVMSTQ